MIDGKDIKTEREKIEWKDYYYVSWTFFVSLCAPSNGIYCTCSLPQEHEMGYY